MYEGHRLASYYSVQYIHEHFFGSFAFFLKTFLQHSHNIFIKYLKHAYNIRMGVITLCIYIYV